MYILFMHLQIFLLDKVQRCHQTAKEVHGTSKLKGLLIIMTPCWSPLVLAYSSYLALFFLPVWCSSTGSPPYSCSRGANPKFNPWPTTKFCFLLLPCKYHLPACLIQTLPQRWHPTLPLLTFLPPTSILDLKHPAVLSNQNNTPSRADCLGSNPSFGHWLKVWPWVTDWTCLASFEKWEW